MLGFFFFLFFLYTKLLHVGLNVLFCFSPIFFRLFFVFVCSNYLAGELLYITICIAVLPLSEHHFPPFFHSPFPSPPVLSLHAEAGQRTWRNSSDFGPQLPPSASWQLFACYICSPGQAEAWLSVSPSVSFQPALVASSSSSASSLSSCPNQSFLRLPHLDGGSCSEGGTMYNVIGNSV